MQLQLTVPQQKRAASAFDAIQAVAPTLSAASEYSVTFLQTNVRMLS